MHFANITLQMKRDFLEYRRSLFWVPLLAMIVPILFVMFIFYEVPSSVVVANGGFDMDGVHFKDFIDPAPAVAGAYFNFQKAGAFEFFAKFDLIVASFFYFFVYVIAISNFSFSSLYADRKNYSILFWRSLPVSEWSNVLAKLLLIGVVIPVILAGLQLICYGLIGLGGAVYAGDLGLLSRLVENPFVRPLWMLFAALFIMPFAGWALFMSAFAKQHPGVIGILIPVLLCVLDDVMQRVVGLNLGVLALLNNYSDLINSYIAVSWGRNSTSLFGVEFIKICVVSISVTALFTGAAIWLRNNRYEI